MRVLFEVEDSSFDEALEAVRRSTVFTTHTPVPAGNESFDDTLARRRLGPLVERLGVPWETVAALGRSRPDDHAFGLTPLALRTAARCNAVSRLHSEVARRPRVIVREGRSTVGEQDDVGLERRDVIRGEVVRAE